MAQVTSILLPIIFLPFYLAHLEQWQRACHPLGDSEGQFTQSLGHQTATQLFKLVCEYRP